MGKTKSLEAMQLQYVYGAGLTVCHIVDIAREGMVMTYCTNRLSISSPGRIIIVSLFSLPAGIRLCKRCAEAVEQQP